MCVCVCRVGDGVASSVTVAGHVTRVSAVTGVFEWSNLMSTQTSHELLYVTLSVVLASSLLTFIAVMFVCAWRQRQRQRILGDLTFSACHVCFDVRGLGLGLATTTTHSR